MVDYSVGENRIAICICLTAQREDLFNSLDGKRSSTIAGVIFTKWSPHKVYDCFPKCIIHKLIFPVFNYFGINMRRYPSPFLLIYMAADYWIEQPFLTSTLGCKAHEGFRYWKVRCDKTWLFMVLLPSFELSVWFPSQAWTNLRALSRQPLCSEDSPEVAVRCRVHACFFPMRTQWVSFFYLKIHSRRGGSHTACPSLRANTSV